MFENRPSAKTILIIVVFLSAGIALGTMYYSLFLKQTPPVVIQPTPSPTITPQSTTTPTLTAMTSPTPTSSIDISGWQEYNSNLTATLLFKNLEAPFSFKYPKVWRLDEGMGGISIYAFNDHVGYDVGAVPEGKFMINIAPDIKDKNNEEIKIWCKNNLYNSGFKEILSEKYLEVDGNKAYSVDYKIGSDNFESIRQVCIAKSGLKMMIFAEPLDYKYLGIFDKVLSTFSFIK